MYWRPNLICVHGPSFDVLDRIVPRDHFQRLQWRNYNEAEDLVLQKVRIKQFDLSLADELE